MWIISAPVFLSNYCFFVLIFSALMFIIVQFYMRSAGRLKKGKHLDLPARNNNNKKAYTLRWKVENLSYCWLKEGKSIKSPRFNADILEGTKWTLELYPNGSPSNSNFVSVFLNREKDCCGPKVIEVKYQLAFLNKDGLILKDANVWGDHFNREYAGIRPLSETREKVFDTERKTFLPEDTLTIQCKLWKEDEKPVVSELLSARTIFKEHRESFVWKIDNFISSSAKGYMYYRDTLSFSIRKLEDGLLEFEFLFNGYQISRKSSSIDIRSKKEDKHLLSFNASIIDSNGEKINCGNHEYFGGDLRLSKSFPLFFTRNMLMKKRSQYLPQDALSFYCEYTISTATALSECPSCSTLFSSVIQENESKNETNFKKEKPKLTLDLQDDLKSLYSNTILCDVELRTSTQTFPAHRIILSARSSVFRRMFSSGMKEKNSGSVDITDLDDETMHRILTYIYTDIVGDLQMEIISKLYTAANKYDIPSLKRRCSSLLSDKLQPITVCGVLVLADVHQDDDLKSAVKEYIMEHDKEVFDTQEWKHFMDTNLHLAAEVMYRKVSESRI